VATPEAEPYRDNSRHSGHKVFNPRISASRLQQTICDIASPHTQTGCWRAGGLLGGRMKRLVRFNSNGDIGIRMEIGESKSNIMYAGQRKEIKPSSHIWLLVNWWTLESAYG
jgi:hypothetical protein